MTRSDVIRTGGGPVTVGAGGGMGQGRIPYRVRVGVTGHRRLPDEGAIAVKVREALDTIRSFAAGRDTTAVRLTVVSALAEGADRLVVREVLKDETADLDAVLPLPAAEYVKDFPATSAEFQGFFDVAATKIELQDPTPRDSDRARARNQAYRQVGRYVVDHSDILIALWDGDDEHGIGGTAEIVGYARKKQIPMLWVNTSSGEIVQERLERVRLDAFDALDEFNREAIEVATFEEQVVQQARWFLPPLDSPALPSVPFTALSDWLLPYFVRADVLALRYQKLHFRLATPIFVLSALAVAFAAAQAVFYPSGTRFVYGEVLCIAALLAVLIRGLWRRPSRRWIAYRYLAERFRSAFFLAAAGLDDRSTAQLPSVNVDDPSAGWVSRAYNEVWKRRPRVQPAAAELAGLRHFLVSAWVGSQRDYHARTSKRHEDSHRRLEHAIWLLLGLTLCGLVLHITERLGDDFSHWFSFLSISLPAVGAALTGFGEQREFELLSERYKRMSSELAAAAERIEEADDDIETIWRLAAETEAVMRQENRDWFGVMRFRDIGPHV